MLIYPLFKHNQGGVSLNSQGPVFIHEPPYKIAFSNVTGGSISCSGSGQPSPEVRRKDMKIKFEFLLNFNLLIRLD